MIASCSVPCIALSVLRKAISRFWPLLSWWKTCSDCYECLTLLISFTVVVIIVIIPNLTTYIPPCQGAVVWCVLQGAFFLLQPRAGLLSL